jgi:hypothetical protein
MNDPWAVLVAVDADKLIFAALVILFLVIAAMGQVLAKIREAQRAEDARRRRAVPGAAPGPRGARPAPPRAQDPLRREVDQFVRDAGKPPLAGRPEKRRLAGPGGAQQPQPGAAPPPPPPSWRAAPSPRSRAAEEPIDVQPAELVPGAEDEGVAEHVRKHVFPQKFGGLTSDVGMALRGAGDSMEGHLHAVFDHELGRLGHVPGESAEIAEAEEAETPEDRITSIPVTAAAGLAAILANPTSLRQAILLNEILQRPEERWE